MKKGISMLYMRVVQGAEQALQWLGNSMTSSGAEYLHSSTGHSHQGSDLLGTVFRTHASEAGGLNTSRTGTC